MELLLLVIEVLDKPLSHLRDTRGTTDEQDFVDLLLAQLCLLEGLFHRIFEFLKDVCALLLQLLASDGHLQVLVLGD